MKSNETAITSLGRRLLSCLLFGALLFLCACSGEGYKMTVTIDPAEGTPIPSDGLSSASIKVTMKHDGELLNSGNITLSTDLGVLKAVNADGKTDEGESTAQHLDVPLNMGVAAARLSSVQPGTAKVRVEYVDEETGVSEASVELNIVFKYALAPDVPSIATIEFISADPETIKIFNTTAAGKTSTKVTFQALDKMNLPVPNKEIYFSIPKPLGGANVMPSSTKTDANGYAVTFLTSSTVAGIAEVVAGTTPYENRDENYISGTAKIHVLEGTANYNNFSFACSETALGGFSGWYGVEMTCTAAVADRDTQEIPNQPVIFATEAGAVLPIIYTDDEGKATTTYYTQDPMPLPVEPSQNAWLYNIPLLRTGHPLLTALQKIEGSITQTGGEISAPNPLKDLQTPYYDSNYHSGINQNNPRDGLVTIIAVTAGEEPLTKDLNSNGICDDGDTFLSIGEPFIDRNDDGIYNDGEYFLDTDGSGTRNDPVGDASHLPYKIANDCSQWKSDTQIWKSTRVMWVGQAAYVGFLPIADRLADAVDYNKLYGSLDSITVHAGGHVMLDVVMLDDRLNSIHGDMSSQLKCSVDGEDVSLTITPATQTVTRKHGPSSVGTVTVSVPKQSGPEAEFKAGAASIVCSISMKNMIPNSTYTIQSAMTIVAAE